MKFVLLLLLLVTIAEGCEKEASPVSEPGTKMKDIHMLKDRSSGYVASLADWQSFLECWRIGASRKVDVDGSRQFLTVLSKYSHLSTSKQPSATEVEEGIVRAESRLGIVLPRSYKDFVRAYRPPKYYPHKTLDGGILGTGMYDLDQIGRLGAIEPELGQFYDELSVRVADNHYYIYGVDQSDVAVRTEYRRDAIVIGSHGPAYYDLIVLYPQQKTRDGEMEASLIFHATEFRAPSFAELMRQLSYMETHMVAHVPPYSQIDLSGGCAKLLPLLDVWWK